MPYGRRWRGAFPPIVGNAGAYYTLVAGDAPVRYWRLGDSSGTVAVDYSGQGRNGTFSGAFQLGNTGAFPLEPNSRATRFGAAGTGMVSVTFPPVTNAFSLEAWVYSPVTWPSGHSSRILTDDSGNSFLSVTASGLARAGFGLGAGNIFLTGTQVLTPGFWHHIVATLNSTNARLYVDNTLVDLLVFSATIVIGFNGGSTANIADGNTAPFIGSIQDVAVYNYQLTIPQIQSHWATGGPQVPSNPGRYSGGAGMAGGRARRYHMVSSAVNIGPVIVPGSTSARYSKWRFPSRCAKANDPVTKSTFVITPITVQLQAGTYTVTITGSNTKWVNGVTPWAVIASGITVSSSSFVVTSPTSTTWTFQLSAPSGTPVVTINDGSFANTLGVTFSSISFWNPQHHVKRYFVRPIWRKQVAPPWFQAVTFANVNLPPSIYTSKNRPKVRLTRPAKSFYPFSTTEIAPIPPKRAIRPLWMRPMWAHSLHRRRQLWHPGAVTPQPRVVDPGRRRATWVPPTRRGHQWAPSSYEFITISPPQVDWVGGTYIIQLTGVNTNWNNSTQWNITTCGVSLAGSAFNVTSANTATWSVSFGPGNPGYVILDDGLAYAVLQIGEQAFLDWQRPRRAPKWFTTRGRGRRSDVPWYQAAAAPNPRITFGQGQRRTRPPYWRRGRIVLPPWPQVATSTNQPYFVAPSGQRWTRSARAWTKRGHLVLPPWGQAAANTNQPFFVRPNGQRWARSARQYVRRGHLWLPTAEAPAFIRPSAQRRVRPPYWKRAHTPFPIQPQQPAALNPNIVFRPDQRRVRPPYWFRTRIWNPPWGQSPTSNNQPVFVFGSGQRRVRPPYIRRGHLWLPTPDAPSTPPRVTRRAIRPPYMQRGRLIWPTLTPATQRTPLFVDWTRRRAVQRFWVAPPRSKVWQTAFGLFTPTLPAAGLPGLYLADEFVLSIYLSDEEPT